MITILPCYSLEDFSIYRTAKDAGQIFSAWTALYHPALIRHCGAMPSWDRAASPSPGKKHDLILIPPCAMGQVSRDWLKRAREAGAIIISDKQTRAEMVRAALDALELVPTDSDDDVETFYALGLSYFISELFSRKLRYMSNLDTQGFRENGLKAAQALDRRDRDEFEKRVRRAFELLTEAKEYFFPKAMSLLDLTVVSGKSLSRLEGMLRRRAARGEHSNLLLPTWHLNRLQNEFPGTVSFLKDEIAAGRITLIGGDLNESPLGLFSPAESAERLLEGWEVYHTILGTVPAVFGRCEAGYSPILPRILSLAECRHALLFTDDGWKGTDEVQSRVNWHGVGGGKVACLSRPAFDGADSKDFMLLPDRVGYSSSGDRALSAIYKHRPGTEQVWLGDLARMTKFAPVLGEVLSLSEFFQKTADSGVERSFGKDAFRTNFLTRAARDGRRNPVSVWPILCSLSARMNALAVLALFAGLRHENRSICGLPGFERLSETASPLDNLKADLIEQISFPFHAALEDLEEDERTHAEEHLRRAESERLVRIGTAEKIESAARETASGFARLLTGEPLNGSGIILLNMSSVPVRHETETCFVADPAVAPYIRVRAAAGKRRVIVTVPPFSMMALRKEDVPLPVSAAPQAKKKLFSRLIERVRGSGPTDPNRMVEFETVRFKDGSAERFYTIRTNYFVMKIDADTGEVRSVRTHIAAQISGRRGILNQPGMGNRIAWQTVMKLSGKVLADDARDENSGGYGYSIMAAEKIEVLSDGPFEAVLEIFGRLVSPGGELLSRFRQRITAPRASRVIEVELEFLPKVLPQDAPWDEYYGVRLAWNDGLAEIRPACHGVFWETTRDFFQAPDLLDIRSEEKLGVSVLGGGLPFYRRRGGRGADAILIPRGEEERVFRFGIGIDLPDPLTEAVRRIQPDPVLIGNIAVETSSLIRFLDVTPSSAAVEDIKPVYEPAAEGAAPETARLAGFRVLLHETNGKGVDVRLTASFPISSAQRVNLYDQPQDQPYEQDDAHSLTLKLQPNEILPVRINVDFGSTGEKTFRFEG